MKKPTKEEVSSIDLSGVFPLIENSDRTPAYFYGEPGVEHYKLLAYIAQNLPERSVLAEIGVLDGCGTIALSTAANSLVLAYDIARHWLAPRVWPRNVCFQVVNKNLPIEELYPGILSASVIFYDAAHEGVEERVFLDYLIRNEWKGIVIWDDIHFNKPMEAFWRSIKQEKEDWTDIGHATGTGIVRL